MRCKKCNSEIHGNWSFCPSCGIKAPEKTPGFMDFFNVGLEDVFNKFMKQSINDAFSHFNEFGAGPQMRRGFQDKNMASGGIEVRIYPSGKNPAAVHVEQSGGHIHASPLQRKIDFMESAPQNSMPRMDFVPKATAEPKTEMVRLPRGIVIEAELPGIASADDVTVLELGESLEIRAPAGDIMYLKIVQIPPGMHFIGKTLSRNKLRVELQQGVNPLTL